MVNRFTAKQATEISGKVDALELELNEIYRNIQEIANLGRKNYFRMAVSNLAQDDLRKNGYMVVTPDGSVCEIRWQ